LIEGLEAMSRKTRLLEKLGRSNLKNHFAVKFLKKEGE
jgi:hypothetical protein